MGPPGSADECQIDPLAFKEFVDALLAWHRGTSHAVMVALSEGFVATVLVLAERAGIEVNWLPAGVVEDGGLKDDQVSAAPVSSEGGLGQPHLRAHNRIMLRCPGRA